MFACRMQVVRVQHLLYPLTGVQTNAGSLKDNGFVIVTQWHHALLSCVAETACFLMD